MQISGKTFEKKFIIRIIITHTDRAAVLRTAVYHVFIHGGHVFLDTPRQSERTVESVGYVVCGGTQFSAIYIFTAAVAAVDKIHNNCRQTFSCTA